VGEVSAEQSTLGMQCWVLRAIALSTIALGLASKDNMLCAGFAPVRCAIQKWMEMG